MSLEQKTWTVKVQELEGTDDFYIEMPDEVLELSGFKAGDPIKWVANDDGTYTLTNKDTND